MHNLVHETIDQRIGFAVQPLDVLEEWGCKVEHSSKTKWKVTDCLDFHLHLDDPCDDSSPQPS